MSNPNVRFMTNNMVTEDNITCSSEDTDFPCSNLADTDRNIVWKPSGNFTIDDTNNKIYYNTGIDHTVTIVNGDYDVDELITAINNALSSASITADYDDLGGLYVFKFFWPSTATFTMKLSMTTNAVWDTIGFDGSADLTSHTDAWYGSVLFGSSGRLHNREFVTVDLGVSTAVGFVGMIWPMDIIDQFSGSATYRVMANNVNDFSSPSFTQSIVMSPNGLFKHFEDEYYRFWRFEISDPQNPTILQFGHLYIGDSETTTSSNVSRGLSHSYADPSTKMESESSKRYFDTRTQYEDFNDVQIANMTAADKDTIEQIAFDYGIKNPIFISFDPTLQISTDVTEYTRFLYFSALPKFVQLFKNYYAVSMAFTEAI
jgi:hypothetical protein